MWINILEIQWYFYFIRSVNYCGLYTFTKLLTVRYRIQWTSRLRYPFIPSLSNEIGNPLFFMLYGYPYNHITYNISFIVRSVISRLLLSVRSKLNSNTRKDMFSFTVSHLSIIVTFLFYRWNTPCELEITVDLTPCPTYTGKFVLT